MNKLTQEKFDELVRFRAAEGESALTLYVPTNRFPTPANMQEDQTRFKNLVREGCEKWSSHTDERTVKKVRNELEACVSDTSFWQAATETLAVFATAEEVQVYHLPLEVEPRSHVGPTFELTPLYILDHINRPFYVFALAMHDSKLYKADMYGVEPVAIDFPASPEDALNIDEMYANSNTVRDGDGGGGGLAFHGQGDSSEAGQEERIKYFRILAEMIRRSKDVDQTLPILVAATESEAGDFKATIDGLNLLEPFLAGNHTKDETPQLHAAAWRIIESELLERDALAVRDRYGELSGAGKSSAVLEDIRAAAKEGRVEALLLPILDLTPDSVSDRSEPGLLVRFPEVYDKEEWGGLAQLVCENGGQLIGTREEHMPEGARIAALYRY